jgi:hypothetical protein
VGAGGGIDLFAIFVFILERHSNISLYLPLFPFIMTSYTLFRYGSRPQE